MISVEKLLVEARTQAAKMQGFSSILDALGTNRYNSINLPSLTENFLKEVEYQQIWQAELIPTLGLTSIDDLDQVSQLKSVVDQTSEMRLELLKRFDLINNVDAV